MTERKQFRAIKGTRDILPPDSARWNWFEHTARKVFESYNFGEIRLPIFEETDLFARSIGEETDVVAKEMFSFSVYEAAGLLLLRDPVVRWPSPWAKIDQFEAYKSIVGQFIADYKLARS